VEGQRLLEPGHRVAEAAGRFPGLTFPGPPEAGRASVAERARTRRAGRRPALTDAATSVEHQNVEAPGTLQSRGPLMSDEMKVPGPGIEPGTRGSSGLVGAWPRPRDPLEKRRARRAP